MNVIRGFATTFKHLFEEPVTIEYPEEERPVRERFKGKHELKRYDNGMEKCIRLRMAVETTFEWNLNPAENQLPIRGEPMRVITLSTSDHH